MFWYSAAFDEVLARWPGERGHGEPGQGTPCPYEGVWDRAVIVGKTYSAGDVVLTIRVTVEGVR
jgi:hypothetical protein